ncbi:tetratricopeptide repeat protein [Pseudooceanicola lipolyticus]|uniref:tetratricopeptide repeat protein n=1 Tax=Pseudooceanicola TaxID=1679449 RepID=UPI001F0CAA60|nr:tetratricopeptide repeat protein [Pseudooceanicola lipolyticus]
MAAIVLTLPSIGAAQSASGAYLAGRQALYSSDFDAAATYYTRALTSDRNNPELMENVILSQLALGRLDAALPLAQMMRTQGLSSQVAHMVMATHMIAEGDFQALLDRDVETLGIGLLVDGLITAWSWLGVGDLERALLAFDDVAEQNGLSTFAHYHKALALASIGQYAEAEAIFAEDEGGLSRMSRRGAIARAQILSQLDRNEDALALLDDAFGGAPLDPGLAAIADRLAAGENVPFDQVGTVRDGLAEVFFSISSALQGEASDDFALIYTRTAIHLRPDHIDALLLAGDLLEGLGQYDLAVSTYRKVPPDSPDYHAAEMGRAEALRRAAKPDAAIEVLTRLADDYPTLPQVHSALGDLQRQQENYGAAADAYDRAIEFTEDGAPSQWHLHYARGISHERLKDWDRAERDFRKALELNPEQPQVLNYLGYSLVERREKLDEALDMIERAVAARPDSGYIVDSLGWVLYRLGRYAEAVAHMEHAVELMPVDPVVNDHLGDVFWAVGRYREAEFQWKRAVSFIDPEDTDGEADPVRIRRKLEVGLDKVLAEEGAPPLKVANDGG